MSINHQDINKLAKLSNLVLSEQEADDAITAINDVLALIDTLQKVDTTSVNALTYIHKNQTITPRQPTPEGGISTQTLLDNAPQQAQGYFLTPKVIE